MSNRLALVGALLVSASVSLYFPSNAHAKEDKDVVAVKRLPPIMPADAMHSGHCTLRFDVSPEGKPKNVKTTFCSDNLFEESSINTVKKWVYLPKKIDGLSVPRLGVETTITYFLTEENGDKLPETEPVLETSLPYDRGQNEAKIIYQFPPYNSRPKKTETSEFCCMVFSVSQIGTPFNVVAENCSNKKFAQSADSLIREWLYDPIQKNGEAVSSGDYTRVIFFVKRKRAMLRDLNGYTPIPGMPDDYSRICKAIS